MSGLITTSNAMAQSEYRYKNQFSTGDEAERLFGIPQSHNRNDPKLDAGEFKFELGSKLECGKLDIRANFLGQFQELQKQLKDLIPNTPDKAKEFLAQSAFVTVCYAYPTICAQLRHDWLSIQGKLNLRAQACAAVDKYIDNQADKGANQLKSEGIAKCVQQNAGSDGDVAAALQKCQTETTGLLLRDFQTGVMRDFGNKKQKVLKSILAFAKDDNSYDFLSAFLGEIEVGGKSGWEPLFEKGIVRPEDVSQTFLTKSQNLICNRFEDILKNRFNGSGIYEKEVVASVKRKLSQKTLADFSDLSPPDRQIACLALGRAIGKDAAGRAATHFESSLSTGLLNTAIPEQLRAEFRDRMQSAFPALRQALDGEDIPSVEQVRLELAEFARLQRTKTILLASESNRGKLKNSLSDSQNAVSCSDSLSCE